jgi:ABC-type multidrug transport system fused ATPase/permease subunit
VLITVCFLLQELLLEDEAQCTAPNINNNTPKIMNTLGHTKANGTADAGVTIVNSSAKWSPDLVRDSLSNITFRVPEGKLCAVIGPVGSGKVRITGFFFLGWGETDTAITVWLIVPAPDER